MTTSTVPTAAELFAEYERLIVSREAEQLAYDRAKRSCEDAQYDLAMVKARLIANNAAIGSNEAMRNANLMLLLDDDGEARELREIIRDAEARMADADRELTLIRMRERLLSHQLTFALDTQSTAHRLIADALKGRAS